MASLQHFCCVSILFGVLSIQLRNTHTPNTHTIMTNQEFTAKAEMMLEKMSVDQLKDMLEQMFHDHRPGADKVFDAVLNHLEKRVSWADFARICNSIN